MSLRETVFDLDVLVLNIASFAQTLPKSSEQMRNRCSRQTVKAPDHWYRWLRSCGERPSRCRSTADRKDELTSPHWQSAQCSQPERKRLYGIGPSGLMPALGQTQPLAHASIMLALPSIADFAEDSTCVRFVPNCGSSSGGDRRTQRWSSNQAAPLRVRKESNVDDRMIRAMRPLSAP